MVVGFRQHKFSSVSSSRVKLRLNICLGFSRFRPSTAQGSLSSRARLLTTTAQVTVTTEEMVCYTRFILAFFANRLQRVQVVRLNLELWGNRTGETYRLVGCLRRRTVVYMYFLPAVLRDSSPDRCGREHA